MFTQRAIALLCAIVLCGIVPMSVRASAEVASGAESIEARQAKTTASATDGARTLGLGFGAGYTGTTGNAGRIYGGSRSPSIDLRAALWLDSHFAIQLSAQNSSHSYDVEPDGLTDVNLFRALLQAKYYFDVPLNPHLIAGSGMYWRSDKIGIYDGATTMNDIQEQNALGFNFGAGIEFRLKPSKLFVQLEGVVHSVPFSDDNDPKFVGAGIPDRSGLWIVAQAAIMYAW